MKAGRNVIGGSMILLAVAAVTVAGAHAALGALAAPTAAAATGAAAPSALRLVQEYNARNIGAPGWRRVFLQLETGGRETQRFAILHFFGRQGGELRSLVVLEAPVGLRGTDYLLIEDWRKPAGLELFLHLPAGEERVLSVVPSRFEEGLLGSDFAYADLRWLLPTEGFRLTVNGSAQRLGRQTWVVEAEPVDAKARESTSWSMTRYYLSSNPPLLLGADFFRRGEAAPAKRLRVETLEQRGGVWTPTRMVMDAVGSRRSVLTLGETGFGKLPAVPDLFSKEALVRNSKRLLAEGFGQAAPAGRKP